MLSFWSKPPWMLVGLGAAAGLAICQIDLFLTSAVLHRGLCHGSIRYPRWFGRGVAAWLWLTVCVPPLTWIAAHRHHHANSDTADDPHPPGRLGVMRVTLLTWYYVTRWARSHADFAERRYLRAFRDERLLRVLDGKVACYANFYLQLAASLLAGPAGLAFWLGRVPVYMLASGYQNAIGHTLGERPYPNLGTDATSRVQVIAGYLLAGELLGHNYHHRHPKSPYFRPRRLDPGYWFATRLLHGVPVEPRGKPPGQPPVLPSPAPEARPRAEAV
jgi:stearoyl-CoA desaturase (delta-9 desaturase)